MLNALELTGRASTHVRESLELGCAVHDAVLAPLLAMRAAARGEGIALEIVSGHRDLHRQVAIWNAKFRGERTLLDRAGRALERARLSDREAVDAILRWSALPGASRHHWGSDVDVVDRACLRPGARTALTRDEFAPGGPFARLSTWLEANAARFGFFRPYAHDRGGIGPEPWHLSYAPIAGPALVQLSPEVLAEAIAGSSMDARDQVLGRLAELYRRYVVPIDSPAETAT
jgi:LAS superfamily LD-carboxypeptidase LdcB